MAQFIQKQDYPQGLAQLLVQQTGQQSDPFASAAGGLQNTIMNLLGGIQERELRRENLTSLESGRRESGIMELSGKGVFTQDGKPVSLQSLLPSLGLPPGTTFTPRPTKELLPDPDILTDSERVLWSRKLKISPEQLSGVRLSALRGLEEGKKPADIGLTEAQKMVDRTFGKEYADFVLAGGYADVQKQLGQIKEVIGELVGEGTTEKPAGIQASGLSGILPKGVRDVVSARGAAIQDRVEDVVQRNLRNVLGAQFTEREGTRLIERAYNPRQPEAENVKRLIRLTEQIDEAAKSKAEAGAYYEKNGTLVGFKGRLYRSPDEFLRDAVKGGKPPKAGKTGDVITIVDSTGKEHQILNNNLEAARKRDPQLKVKGE